MMDLGEQPTPEIEPAEPPPGGVDAVEDELYSVQPVVPQLPTTLNPHLDVPEPIKEGEDTEDGATSDGATEPEKETQA